MQKSSNKGGFFKQLAMDTARVVCSVLIPVFRMKRLTPDGEKYKGKIKGGAIIAANHTSFLDPFIVGVTFWYRRMHMLVAEIVMGGKFRSILLRGVGGIKIDRNIADLEAIKQSVEVLKGGRLLAIFPQGGINEQDDVDSIKSGAVFMALRASVPIIPMYIRPKKHWYDRRTVVIGETVYPNKLCSKKMPSTADIEAITKVLAENLAKCKNAK
jgi:1-acyl-sn-glycerol-3-phosphate acyltransferase